MVVCMYLIQQGILFLQHVPFYNFRACPLDAALPSRTLTLKVLVLYVNQYMYKVHFLCSASWFGLPMAALTVQEVCNA